MKTRLYTSLQNFGPVAAVIYSGLDDVVCKPSIKSLTLQKFLVDKLHSWQEFIIYHLLVILPAWVFDTNEIQKLYLKNLLIFQSFT